MKVIFSFILCLLMSCLSYSQDLTQSRMLKDVEVKAPVFTGIKGAVTILHAEETEFESINDYLMGNVEYPQEEINRYREGKAIVQFTVTPSGNLSNFEVINSVSDRVDKEVIRVLKSTDGMWKPGYNNDTPVAMRKEISIVFRMERSDHIRMAQMHFKRGSKKLQKNKPLKALRQYDKALVYQPTSEAILFQRGITRFNVGNTQGACKDWNRLKTLGSDIVDEYLANYCEMEQIAISDK